MSKTIKIIISLLLIFLPLGLIDFEWLILKNIGQNETVLVAPLTSGNRFCMRFTHSVALTPVDECFVAEGDNIVLKRTIYEDFGAGLPHDLDEGQSMSVQDGKIYIDGFSLKIKNFQVRVGRIAKHTLMLPSIFSENRNHIRLDTVAKAGEALSLSVTKESILRTVITNWSDLYLRW